MRPHNWQPFSLGNYHMASAKLLGYLDYTKLYTVVKRGCLFGEVISETPSPPNATTKLILDYSQLLSDFFQVLKPSNNADESAYHMSSGKRHHGPPILTPWCKRIASRRRPITQAHSRAKCVRPQALVHQDPTRDNLNDRRR
jgi:hypothetical protein